jgi:hypothetical protein
MQSRWLRLYQVHVADALAKRARIESGLPGCKVQLTVRGAFGVLTTPDYDTALAFCVRAGAMPDVLDVAELEHDAAVARWL